MTPPTKMPPSPMNPHLRALSPLDRAEATCWMLLARYGIVFRELLARETNLPPWRELQWAFRRLEAQGQIRGGRFVSGFAGEQFALPAAVESLRELRNLPVSNELITISAADPLNLVGILVPGERIPAIGPRSVSFRAGVYVPDAGAARTAPVPGELRRRRFLWMRSCGVALTGTAAGSPGVRSWRSD